jgi:hypothetical protein
MVHCFLSLVYYIQALDISSAYYLLPSPGIACPSKNYMPPPLSQVVLNKMEAFTM